MVNGIPTMRSATDRLRGYRKVASVGLAADRRPRRRQRLHRAGGFKATQELARRAPFDAVVAASDVIAAGVLRALKLAGRAVPDDVSLIGSETRATPRHRCDPPLTTVAQPTVEMGNQLARLTIAAIEGHDERRSVIMPARLVIRASFEPGVVDGRRPSDRRQDPRVIMGSMGSRDGWWRWVMVAGLSATALYAVAPADPSLVRELSLYSLVEGAAAVAEVVGVRPIRRRHRRHGC